jgi:ornithine--oxo-acid transaminase
MVQYLGWIMSGKKEETCKRRMKEALNILEDDKLVENSRAMGETLRNALRKLNSPLITDVRGKGLLVGMEIDDSKASARVVCEQLMKNGVLTKEAHETVVRLAPPLIIDQPLMAWAIDTIGDTLKTMAG